MSVFSVRNREYAIERIPFLMKKFPESWDILDFYKRVLQFQLQLYTQSKNDRWEDKVKKFYELLELSLDCKSENLSKTAKNLLKQPIQHIQNRIREFLKEKTATEEERFFFISFLNPFISKKAEEENSYKQKWNESKCPICGFKAVVSYVSDTEEVQGGRFLVCQVCNYEWLYNRTSCVKCKNNEDDTIHYFFEESSRYIQIQACDACGTYIKVVDMRVDGLAVPLLEDIASLTLDLWMRQQGYEKFERNVFGL